jgi:hypothetical protein
MTNKPSVWVVSHGDGWAVRREGASRISSSHDTQAAAIDQGRDTARREHVELLWHGRDGKIQGRNSYGADQFPPKG